MQTHQLSFFTEYYQFYILDKTSQADTGAADFWNTEADKRRLAIGDSFLGITVAKYATIDVKIKILKSKPKPNLEADHIVETTLNLPSGHLEVKNCTGFETEFEAHLEAAAYQVRVSSFKLDTVQNDVGNDHYLVEIWKSKTPKTIILKEWKAIFLA